jgi:hypothetical protein
MQAERNQRVQQLSEILGRMHELVRLLKGDPEPERFVALLRELSDLFIEAEFRLKQLGG